MMNLCVSTVLINFFLAKARFSFRCLKPRPEGQGNSYAIGMDYCVGTIIPAHQNKI